MKQKIVIVTLFWVGIILGQEISSSPYSALGVGDILFDNTVEHAAMGGLDVAVESPFYSSANFTNPAANRNLSTTTFDFTLNSDLYEFESNNGTATNSSSYVAKIALAFPINEKTKVGFGFQPYSADGYDISNTTVVANGPDIVNDFEGDGGLNSLHLIGSRNLTKELSVGVRANFLFGEIIRSEQVVVEGLELLTDNTYENQLSGFQFSGGAFYSKKIKKDKSLNIGLNYTLGSNLSSDVTNLTTTYFPVNGVPVNQDTIQITELNGADTKLPQELSLGLSYTKNSKWLVGLQVDYGNWSDFELAGDEGTLNSFRNRFRTSLGGYWLPNFNSYKSYFERITYRAGAYYEQTPLSINNTNIDQYGITFGLSLPVGKGQQDLSRLDFALELGERGTLDNNLIRERFAKIKVGFTLNALWFQKRVYQ